MERLIKDKDGSCAIGDYIMEIVYTRNLWDHLDIHTQILGVGSCGLQGYCIMIFGVLFLLAF